MNKSKELFEKILELNPEVRKDHIQHEAEFLQFFCSLADNYGFSREDLIKHELKRLHRFVRKGLVTK